MNNDLFYCDFVFIPLFISGHPKSLDQFDYSDSDIADIVTSCTRNLSYLGISGKIKFGYYGNPMKTIKIDQIQG